MIRHSESHGPEGWSERGTDCAFYALQKFGGGLDVVVRLHDVIEGFGGDLVNRGFAPLFRIDVRRDMDERDTVFGRVLEAVHRVGITRSRDG